ncbi:diacylglycerol/lipid kinase family protein [Enterococcus raffinosus]|uniref:Diacylglycerol kinase family lipid kinase n=1 Tax=Enterococcus raffinosus TaxID=71452 RepID=A0AAW8TAI8_9ENTE|nr:diacylglycerol kinase family protein [Enterococcus raffinosus]MDT2522646.1 diacylglycerol kinase family lipid kinase [Enterococcus raffinosus]MDT2529966.1 diacylglycerol kinase family lipid kinase [Enterococcus raffinosus]MDT2532990.1 diacylglycerol kinase family lipid kinase [Enterococcus raffinosus]MDT2543827.1 diacylglycerol kinase family lipid kinase [Enterococcus raffinosus]MDT2555036.1 diacylglycerol kinase family lipid kinase [Enterococcus raffinosus]
MKKAVLIINPSSGNEEAKNYETQAREKLAQFFDEVEVKETAEGGDATKFARKAAEEKVDSVFAMGGDGTVNEAISGLAEQSYRPTFGFFPLGTVNDLARSLNISMDPQEAIESFDIEQKTSLDIGKVNDEYFMNIVSVGSIPEAISDVDVEEKTKFGKLAYFVNGVKEVFNDENYHFTLEIDGERTEIESSAVVIVLTRTIGGFTHIVPEAKNNDGNLYLLYLKDQSITDRLKSVPDIIKGVDQSTDTIGYTPFKEGRLTVKEEAELRPSVDGDEGPEFPLTIKVLPQHLDVYCGGE